MGRNDANRYEKEIIMRPIHTYLLALLLLLALPIAAEYRTPVQYEKEIRGAFHAEDYAHGKALLDEAEPDYGTLSVFCELKGIYFMHEGDYDEARKQFLLSLRDDDANVNSLEMLVKLEREEGNYSTAIAHVNNLLEFSPYNARLWRTKIELYRLDGNDLEADRLLHRLYSIYPQDTLVKRDVVYQDQLALQAARRNGDIVQQEKYLRSILSTDPQNAEAYQQLVTLLLRTERRSEAIATAAQGYTMTGNRRLRSKYLSLIEEETLQNKERDSALVERTAKRAATLVMEGIYAKEKEEREYVDPEVLEARERKERAEKAERDRLRFMGDAIDSSYAYIRRKEAQKALPLLDSVLQLEPKHNEAVYVHSMANEQLHQWDSAYRYLSKYHPLPEEVWGVRRHLHTLAMRTHKNQLSFEYQYARRSSLDQLTHNAYLTYSRKFTRDVLTVHADYAGRESYEVGTDEGAVMTGGGTGVQLGADWAHSFHSLPIPLELTLQGAWSSKFFPQWTAMVSLQEELPMEWTLTERIGYRRILNETDNFHLLQVGAMVSKPLGQFILIPALDMYVMMEPTASGMRAGVYANGSIKMQFFPIEGDRSCVFAQTGVGNAPETSVLNTSLPVQFAHLNTFVSGGLHWVFTDNLASTLAASWYTLGGQTNNPNTIRNYLYINANLLISF